MDWARLVAYITGTFDQELLLGNEYLAAENRNLKAQIRDSVATFWRLESNASRNWSWVDSQTAQISVLAIRVQKAFSGLFAVGMTTIAFPGTGLGRLSTMSTAVVLSTLRDGLAGINFALTSFVCTIFERHLILLLAKQICQSNISHERNCSVMLIPNTPVVRKLKTTQPERRFVLPENRIRQCR